MKSINVPKDIQRILGNIPKIGGSVLKTANYVKDGVKMPLFLVVF